MAPRAMFKRFPIFVGGSAIGAVIDYVVTLSASNYINLYPPVALILAIGLASVINFVISSVIIFAKSPA